MIYLNQIYDIFNKNMDLFSNNKLKKSYLIKGKLKHITYLNKLIKL